MDNLTNDDAYFSGIGINDSFMFGYVMQDPKICKQFLEQILGIDIDHVEYVEREKDVNNRKFSHGVRLDIYATDGKTIYNCEMQKKNHNDLPMRSRYYQGQIDVMHLKPGEDYNLLKKTFIIFICNFDVFGEERYIYTFENRCNENYELQLNDESVKIFVNTKGHIGDVSDDFKELIHFLDTSEIKEYNNPLVNDLANAVENARTDSEWRHDYMLLADHDRDVRTEGFAEGKAEGKAEGRVEGRNLINELINLLVSSNH